MSNLTAKIEHGAVKFNSIPTGSGFFFGGQFTQSNVKTSEFSYSKPYFDHAFPINPETLVYPDLNKYVG